MKWNREKEELNWGRNFPVKEFKINTEALLKKLKKYDEAGLNAHGISEALMNIVIFQALPREMSVAKEKLPRIRRATEKARRMASLLSGDNLIRSLAPLYDPCIERINEIKKRIHFLENQLISRKKIGQKKPSMTNVHRFESGLVLYFKNSGYQPKLGLAIDETRKLLRLVNHLMSHRQLKEIYQRMAKEAEREVYDIRYCGALDPLPRFIPKK